MRNKEDDENKDNGASSQHVEVQNVSIEEYNGLTKRLDSMETSVGVVLKKVYKVKKFFSFN